MTRIANLLSVVLVALLAQTVPSDVAASLETAATDGSADRIRAHVRFLADDLLEGRLAGTRGYDLAANYVAAQFATLGLQPGAIDGGWLQTLQLIEASAVIPAAQLTLTREGVSTTLTVGDDFLPIADTNAAESTVSAPLVFVGFGVYAPALHHDDLAGLELRGKIAVLLSGAPERFPSTERAHYSTSLTKYPELIRRGVVGVLTFLTPGDNERNPWERSLQSSWRPRMRWLDAQGVAADSFPQLACVMSLSPAGAAKVFASAPRSLSDVFAAAGASRAQGFALPGSASLKRQSLLGKRSSANVLGMLRGSDPRLAREIVVVSAHLDHLGKGAPVNGDGIYNGAVDNASGVAVLLEVARALAGGRERPRRSVLFAALTGEESGLLGSDFLARHPPLAGGVFVANVNIDMPVMLTAIADLVAFGAEHSDLGPTAARAAQAEGLTLTPDPMPEETIFVRSDQYSFVRQGIPAIYLDHGVSALPRVPVVDTRALVDDFLRNHYHQPSDEIALPRR
jgi:Peptidase family M28